MAPGQDPEGETQKRIRSRIQSVLERLAACDGQRIALVGHGYWIGFMGYMLRRAAGAVLPPIPPQGWVENGSFTKVIRTGEGVKLVYFSVPVERVFS